jgi:hypothetical protein
MNTDQTQEEQKVPSKEELIAFFNEQIEVKRVQYELQELNTKLAVAKAEEIKALAFIGQMTQQGNTGERPEGMPHTITQEDMDNNPELADEGVSVGDEVIIPTTPPVNKPRSLKKEKQ